ncbi:MAG: hypothetical protein H7Y09_02315 [Chitinophagaceae bacterium]|nr:hypothetical protein [Anaerolineae bacterium]
MIRFRVTEPKVTKFVEQRTDVDEALKQLVGFLYAQLIHITGEQWLLLVYWNSRADATAAQAITRDMPLISQWIGIADEFLSFETADVRYVTASASS